MPIKLNVRLVFIYVIKFEEDLDKCNVNCRRFEHCSVMTYIDKLLDIYLNQIIIQNMFDTSFTVLV